MRNVTIENESRITERGLLFSHSPLGYGSYGVREFLAACFIESVTCVNCPRKPSMVQSPHKISHHSPRFSQRTTMNI
jgi:hypothetical protein